MGPWFGDITPVPLAKEMVEMALAELEHNTPNVPPEKSENLATIRTFHTRKVSFLGGALKGALGTILAEFPKLDGLHPFHADLFNVLYDKDRYNMALGKMSAVLLNVEAIQQDYVRLLEYGDTADRCRDMNTAAQARMTAAVEQESAALSYLEEVRQHLQRIHPHIDVAAPTILVVGSPNVGKSMLVNNLSHTADADVQPFAFTTKSLKVSLGTLALNSQPDDHERDMPNNRKPLPSTDSVAQLEVACQVIDTPGLLDAPLEDRSIMEMQTITALAHLRACVLFLIDISEQCGYPIHQQVSLFQSIRPLFVKKPVIVVLSKADVVARETLKEEDKALLTSMEEEGVTILCMPSHEVNEHNAMDDDGHTNDTMMDSTRIKEAVGRALQKHYPRRLGKGMNKDKGKEEEEADAVPDMMEVEDGSDDKNQMRHHRATTSINNKNNKNNTNTNNKLNSRRECNPLDLRSPAYQFDPILKVTDPRKHNVNDYQDTRIASLVAELDEEEKELLREAREMLEKNRASKD